MGGTETNPDPVVLNFNNVEGQFIRIIGKGAYADGKLTTSLNQHTSIRDVQIFGQKGDEVYTYSNQGTSTDALNPQKMSPTNDNQNVGSSGDYGENSKSCSNYNHCNTITLLTYFTSIFLNIFLVKFMPSVFSSVIWV